MVTAFPVAHSFGDLAIPEVKVIFHGCRYGLLFIVRLDDNLYLDAEVVEGHVVFTYEVSVLGSFSWKPKHLYSKGMVVIMHEDKSL